MWMHVNVPLKTFSHSKFSWKNLRDGRGEGEFPYGNEHEPDFQ